MYTRTHYKLRCGVSLQDVLLQLWDLMPASRWRLRPFRCVGRLGISRTRSCGPAPSGAWSALLGHPARRSGAHPQRRSGRGKFPQTGTREDSEGLCERGGIGASSGNRSRPWLARGRDSAQYRLWDGCAAAEIPRNRQGKWYT